MSEGQELTPKPRIIQFKGEQGKIQQVNLGNLGTVFANIEAHNKDFSLGTMLAKGLSSHIRKQDGEGSASSSLFSAEKDKGDVLSETLGIIHADSFSQIGISLDTASETGARLMTKEEEIAETKIQFGLQDPDLFLSFLDALNTMDKKELSDSAISPLISKIGYDLFLQIYQHYNNYHVDERVLKIEPRLSEIVSRYKNLGISAKYGDTDRTEDLGNYAKYADQGILKEYVVVDHAGLFAEPNDEKKSYATLANWGNDIGLKSVQERWEKAISILAQIKSNPKARGLMAKIKANLSNCVEVALKDIDSKDENWDKENEWAQRKEKREIFENAKINLQIM